MQLFGTRNWARVSRAGSVVLVVVLALACSRHSTSPEPEPSSPTNKLSRSGALSSLGEDRGALAEVAERVLPSVVSVASTRAAKMNAQENPFDNPLFRRFFGPNNSLPIPMPPGEAPDEHGLGSGVIVGKDLILTNAHVVEGAKEIEVTAGDRRSLEAKVIGTDAKSDLAVLRITSDTSGLRSLEFADSSRAHLGQIVLAVGNPFGVGQTVTMGIISAKGRADLGIEAYEDFIQTDAAINPGNSGGALVDLEGKLVGIPTAILSRSGGYMGVGFAIPSNMAKPILTSLVEHGKVVRGYLGVAIQNIDQELAKALKLQSTDGVLLSDVTAGGPASKAGLMRGDVVVSINGHRVYTTGELRNAVASAGAGARVKVETIRNGKQQTFDVTLDPMPEEESTASTAAPSTSGKLGVTVAPLDAAARARAKVPADVRGVLVTGVEPGSPAAAAGLRPGDVIEQVDGQALSAPGDLAERWSKGSGTTPLLVFREGHTFFVAVKH